MSLAMLALAPAALAQVAVEDPAPAPPPPTGALAGWGAPRLADEQARSAGWLGAWAQFQSRATLLDQDVSPQADPATYGDPEDDPGFGIVRARLGLDGALPIGALGAHHQIDWAMTVGVGAPFDTLAIVESDVQLVEAFGRWTVDNPIGPSSVSVGLQRVPFVRQALISSADLVFQDRTIASEHLTPTQEVGAIAAQTIAFGDGGPLLLVRGGAFNGEGGIYGGVDPGVRGVARVEFAAGDAYRTWSPQLENAIGVGAAYMVNNEIATSDAALAADLLARFKYVTLTADFVQSTVKPGDTVVLAPSLPTETVRRSIAGQLSVWIPFKEANGLEVAGRYEMFDDSTGLDDYGDVQKLDAGVLWRNPFPFVDLGADFIHRIEPNGEFANDSLRLYAQLRPRHVWGG